MKDKRHIKSFNEASENLNISDVSCAISYNESEEMMSIKDKNGKSVFYGNYWDFNNEPKSISKLLTSLWINVNLDDKLESVE